jgi:manganese/zinc/iron transport system permease protein
VEVGIALRNVLLGATLLGAVGGMVGCFALLRRQSLLGDALAHAALPGIAVAFLLTGSKHPMVLLAGALVAGMVGSLLMLAVVKGSRVKEDSAMGIVLSVFFGLGIVLLTIIQRMPTGNKAGLDHFLFGQAATLLTADVLLMVVLSAVVLVVVLALYKEFKLLSFDPAFGASLGLPMRRIEVMLTALLVVVVVVGLQMVGVVLMIATVITPAAAARQWTDRLGVMLVVAAAVGGLSGSGGALLSAAVPGLPTGPTIVVLLSAIMVVSLLLAPQRGIVWRALRGRGVARRIRREHLLKDLYAHGERSGQWLDAVDWATLAGRRGTPERGLHRSARRLVARGLVERAPGALRLTRAGRSAAAGVVRKHRLWEVYLSRRLDLPDDHVHRDADDMEHALSDATVHALDERLGYPKRDPHGQPIPRGDLP